MSDELNKLIDEGVIGEGNGTPGVSMKGGRIIVDPSLPPLQPGRYLKLNWIPEAEWVTLSVSESDLMLGNPETKEFLCVRTYSAMYTILDKVMDYEETQKLAKTVDLTSYNIGINNLGPMERMSKQKDPIMKRRFERIAFEIVKDEE